MGPVTSRAVEETVPTGLIDTPGLQHVFQRPPAVIAVPAGQKLIMLRIVRFTTRRARPRESAQIAVTWGPSRRPPSAVGTAAVRGTLLRLLARRS